MKNTSIDWEEVRVGEIYSYEEGYYLQCRRVYVSSKAVEIGHEYIEFEIVCLEDGHNCKKGERFAIGKTTGEGAHYTDDMKFKVVGSDFDYVTPTFPPRKELATND